MASLRDIKSKIKAVGKTRQVTRAMEAVSAAKMRKSQERALTARPYALSAFRILRRVSGGFESREHPLMKEREMKKALVVLITSDRGLAGGLNSNVIKRVLLFMRENGLSKDSVSFITIGRKGYEYFSKRGYTIEQDFQKIGDLPAGQAGAPDTTDVVRDAAYRAVHLFRANEVSHVYVAYSNFVSTFSQNPLLHRALPLSFADVTETIKGIVPVKGKFSDMFKDEKSEREEGVNYLIEPSPEAVLEQLVYDLIGVLIYHGILEARASEFSARMVAMRSASDKALEMGSALTLSYNKARQSTITREVSEIVGGVEALAA